jgi:CHAT domain-containing protein
MELNAVTARWQASRGVTAKTYLGSDATEENFKQDAPGKSILHLATHGFYLSDACKPKAAIRGIGAEIGGFVGENPFLQCGFLLAGANKHGERAKEANREDGIVTAEDVAGLNLRGCDLVVLSARETGLGEVKSGEGVYGLRRAFQMEGARTVISALWSIDDKSTAEFMGQLFSASNETLPETMQRIALSRLSELRSRNESDHPFFWAAFVATGDWKTH